MVTSYIKCNETNPLISLVIPVYNVEKYIERCIRSVIHQTYKNIEIILIDDGSTDQSGVICDKCKCMDCRIQVVHKYNGGLSDARNYGIRLAKGKYISFIDSDDYIEEDMVEYLYYLLEKYKCEISVCGHKEEFEQSGKSCLQCNKEEILVPRKCIEKILYSGISVSACGKLYLKSLFDGIEYPCGALFEDVGTIYKVVLRATKIVCGDLHKYHYCVRENSITTGKFSVKSFDLIKYADAMCSEILNLYPELQIATIRYRIWARFSTLNRMMNSPKKYSDMKYQMIHYIQDNGYQVLKDKKAPVRDKIAVYLLKNFGWSVYRLSWSIFCRLKTNGIKIC